MANARTLTFAPYSASLVPQWDHQASVSGSESYAILHSNYRFEGIAGVTYDVFSSSYFDPYLLEIFDSYGNVIAANDEYDDGVGGTYDYDTIYNFVAPYTGTYYVDASWHQGSYYKYYSLSIYADYDTASTTSTTFNTIVGTEYRDLLVATSASDIVNGGGEIDFLTYAGNRSNYDITRSGSDFIVQDKVGSKSIDILSNIERLVFDDMRIALTTDGIDGQIYRLYQAAFNRKPDLDGLGFWFYASDSGATLNDISDSFLKSEEFKALYGVNTNNSTLLTAVYNNVLHRDPDQGGLNFWLPKLESGAMSQSEIIVAFSESAENQAQVIGSITNGIEYIPFLN